jgi:hypothetical protein
MLVVYFHGMWNRTRAFLVGGIFGWFILLVKNNNVRPRVFQKTFWRNFRRLHKMAHSFSNCNTTTMQHCQQFWPNWLVLLVGWTLFKIHDFNLDFSYSKKSAISFPASSLRLVQQPLILKIVSMDQWLHRMLFKMKSQEYNAIVS